MCRYCTEYGNGTKWYLNPDNHRPELMEKPGHNHAFMMLSGADKNSFEVGQTANYEVLTTDFNKTAGMGPMMERVSQHQGQVLPLEDAIQVLEMSPGGRFILMHCACRRYFGHEDFYSCLFFEPVIERALAERPWETDSKILSKEEAIEFEKEMDRKGLVHSLWDAGVDTDGKPPIVMCHCLETDCMPTRVRSYFGVPNSQMNSEYVAVVEGAKCREGCQNKPACMHRCPFGAMRYSPLQQVLSINISQCFGCGLCRRVCPTQAISLVDRVSFPALVDVW